MSFEDEIELVRKTSAKLVRHDVDLLVRNGNPIETKFWTAIRRANWRP